MKFPTSIAAAIAPLMLLTTGAMAADLSAPMMAEPAPMAMPATDWTGFYAGVFAGYHTAAIRETGCVGFCEPNPRLDGALAGVQAGYDYEFSNGFVAGAFAWVPFVHPHQDFNMGVVYNLHPKLTAVVAGRIGYDMGQFMPYAFAGVDYTRLEFTVGGEQLPERPYRRGARRGRGVQARRSLLDRCALHVRHPAAEDLRFRRRPGAIWRAGRTQLPDLGELSLLIGRI